MISIRSLFALSWGQERHWHCCNNCINKPQQATAAHSWTSTPTASQTTLPSPTDASIRFPQIDKNPWQPPSTLGPWRLFPRSCHRRKARVQTSLPLSGTPRLQLPQRHRHAFHHDAGCLLKESIAPKVCLFIICLFSSHLRPNSASSTE